MDNATYQVHLTQCINTGHALDTLINFKHNYRECSYRARNCSYFEGAEYALEYAIERIHAVMVDEWSPVYEPVETIDDMERRVHHVIACINQKRHEYERYYDSSDFARGHVDGYTFALRIIGNWLL